MNKHLKLMTVAAIAVMSILACKKDKSEDPVAENECKVAVLNGVHNGNADVTVNFTYDINSKLKSFSNGTDITTYTYSADKIVINENGRIVNVTLANGKAVKLQEDGSTNYLECFYTTDGYLSIVKTYKNGVYAYQNELTYTNGNVSKVSHINAAGYVIDTFYEYSTDLNKSNIAITHPILKNELDYYIPVEYMGKQNKNVILKSSSTFTNGTDRSDNSDTYNYVKDSNGNYLSIDRIKINKSYTSSVLKSTLTDTYKYNLTYNCK